MSINERWTVWSLFFFFQAEDGIRDLTVTGVQTCALPIFDPLPHAHAWLRARTEEGIHPRAKTNHAETVSLADLRPQSGVGNDTPGDERSEERRVGKECRSRWSPYH